MLAARWKSAVSKHNAACVVVAFAAWLPSVAGCTDADENLAVRSGRISSHETLAFSMAKQDGLMLKPKIYRTETEFIVAIDTDRLHRPFDPPLFNSDFAACLCFRDGAKLECADHRKSGVLIEGGSLGWSGRVVFRCSPRTAYRIHDVAELRVRFRNCTFRYSSDGAGDLPEAKTDSSSDDGVR